MITVKEATDIITSNVRSYGTEVVALSEGSGRVLAEDILCDRDLPPFDRVTMDGIAINYQAFEKGIRKFRIAGTQAAGVNPIDLTGEMDCIEIMTGASLPGSLDTVIRNEDLEIGNGTATVVIDSIRKGQNIHYKSSDKKQGDVAAGSGQVVDPTIVSIAATVGKAYLPVKKLPHIAVISTGDELVDIDATPEPYQVRKSNLYTIREILNPYCATCTIDHLTDSLTIITQSLNNYINNSDVIILSGGVSAGKFDHLPEALKSLGVQQLFHKIQQRPGKPFWFGRHANGCLVFAFPGNPVSAFLCMYRYFLPWLSGCLGIKSSAPLFAVLGENTVFRPNLQYFMQVAAGINEEGRLWAVPVPGNGSGDLSNLVTSNAFLELPAGRDEFMAGEVFPLWKFKTIV